MKTLAKACFMFATKDIGYESTLSWGVYSMKQVGCMWQGATESKPKCMISYTHLRKTGWKMEILINGNSNATDASPTT